MGDTQQDEVLAYLGSAATHGGQTVERIDTHSAIVLLVGDRALKVKRAVTFDYLDFSTAGLRRDACEAEVRINRRMAPRLYRGVGTVTREADGSLATNGPGVPVEWFVDMTRFDQEALLDGRALRGQLDLASMRALGAAVACFHLGAEARPDHGGRAGMAWVVDGNEQGFAQQGRGILDPSLCADVTARCRAELARLAPLLEARRRQGLVRQCHGDLHLRNIVLLDGVPTLFDAIEFNDEIACGDVLYDLAFLLMDLWRQELPQHANAVFNGYFVDTVAFGGLPLLPFFLACRAAVHAKTSATAAHVQTDAHRRDALEQQARAYLALSRTFLSPAPPRLVAIGGFSGSGKSTLARTLAPSLGGAPGALILRSDEVRKALSGVGPLERLPAAGYGSQVTSRVYDTLAAHASLVLNAGHAVIADAVFARPEQRARLEDAAARAGVPFLGLWLDAPECVLAARTLERRGDASDATPAVVHQQLLAGAGAIGWHRMDASRSTDALARNGQALLHDADGTTNHDSPARPLTREDAMDTERLDEQPRRAPHEELERALIDAFLRERGYDLARLDELPEEARHALLQQASTYASARLTEIESRAHLVHELHATLDGQGRSGSR